MYLEVSSTIGRYGRSSKFLEEEISIIKNGDTESFDLVGSSSHIFLAEERSWGSNGNDVSTEGDGGTSRHSSNNAISQVACDSA